MTAVATEPSLADRRRQVEQTVRRLLDTRRVDVPGQEPFEIKNCISTPRGSGWPNWSSRPTPGGRWKPGWAPG